MKPGTVANDLLSGPASILRAAATTKTASARPHFLQPLGQRSESQSSVRGRISIVF
jgi:hypothetical protein